MGRKFNKFKEKAKAAVKDAKDYINNDLENDAQKAAKTAAEQVERYVDKYLVDDLHSAGEAINKAVDQIKNVAHCVELCSSGSEVVAKDSCMNDNVDA